jgi:predicted lipoprotein with Yx(FWY)xxD motif
VTELTEEDRAMGTRFHTCLLVALSLVLAACGADGTDDTAADASGAGAQEDGQEDGATTAADLAVADSDYGEILVDGAGMTLYLFTEDRDGRSVCEDDCAAAWPPLTVDHEPVADEGVDGGLLGTTERADGSTQVTYAGWPLYTWAQDQQPGDITGQGVQEVWFVVSPAGDAVTEAAAEEPTRDAGY